MNFSQLAIPEVVLSPVVSKNGVKTGQCSYRGGKCEFLLSKDEWLRSPFGATSYKDESLTRLTFEVDVTNSATLEKLQELDAWAIEYAIANGIFEGMRPEQIREQYNSILHTNEKYNSIRLRTKLNSTANRRGRASTDSPRGRSRASIRKRERETELQQAR